MADAFHARRAALQLWLDVVGLPRHLVVANAPQTLQIDASAVHERKAAARDQMLHNLRDEDLAGLGARADAEGGVNGRSEQTALGADGLAGIDADAELNRLTSLLPVVARESLLDGDGALDGARSRGEGRLHPVARVDDLRALVGGEALANQHVVGPNHIVRLRVTGA